MPAGWTGTVLSYQNGPALVSLQEEMKSHATGAERASERVPWKERMVGTRSQRDNVAVSSRCPCEILCQAEERVEVQWKRGGKKYAYNGTTINVVMVGITF